MVTMATTVHGYPLLTLRAWHSGSTQSVLSEPALSVPVGREGPGEGESERERQCSH